MKMHIQTHTEWKTYLLLCLPKCFLWELFLSGWVKFCKLDVRSHNTGQEAFPVWCYGHNISLRAQVSGTGLESLPRLHACSQQEQVPSSCPRLPRTVWCKYSSPETAFVAVFAIALQQVCVTTPLQGHHPFACSCSSHTLGGEGSPAAQFPHRGLNITKQNFASIKKCDLPPISFKFPLT